MMFLVNALQVIFTKTAIIAYVFLGRPGQPNSRGDRKEACCAIGAKANHGQEVEKASQPDDQVVRKEMTKHAIQAQRCKAGQT